MPETKNVEMVNVTYTLTSGKRKNKVTFKAPKGTIFESSSWKKKEKNEVTPDFILKAVEDINLGELTSEKHKLLTYIRYADSKPDLTSEDIEKLTKIEATRNGIKSDYILSSKEMYLKDHSINIETNKDNKASVQVLSEKKLLNLLKKSLYHKISVELPEEWK